MSLKLYLTESAVNPFVYIFSSFAFNTVIAIGSCHFFRNLGFNIVLVFAEDMNTCTTTTDRLGKTNIIFMVFSIFGQF